MKDESAFVDGSTAAAAVFAEPVATPIRTIGERLDPVYRFFTESFWVRHAHDAGTCDFVFGNPHEMPLAGFTAALQQWIVPQNKDWHAYHENEAASRAIIAHSLQTQRAQVFEPDDIFMTNGGFAALAVALRTVVEPGDEVIFISPPWFFYEALILAAHGDPVRVRADAQTFDLDLAAIEAAITPKTRAIIVNSPNNPTGKIYPPETLRELAELLTQAGERNGRPIYLLSDEAYCRILFDGRAFPSPTAFYPRSLLLYTYGKTLLTPGERLGYIALPPTMPTAERRALGKAIFVAQLVTGFAFPNALLQHALADLDKLIIDIEALQRKRDRLYTALRGMGYHLHSPEGTFYLLVQSPLEDDMAFAEILAQHNILCLPGEIVEMPGYFRLSLTANEEMVERSLPGFQAALDSVRSRSAVNL